MSWLCRAGAFGEKTNEVRLGTSRREYHPNFFIHRHVNDWIARNHNPWQYGMSMTSITVPYLNFRLNCPKSAAANFGQPPSDGI